MNAVFFDMDGTLIDSRADLGATVNFTRAALGLAPIPLEEAISYVGNGARFLGNLGGLRIWRSDEVFADNDGKVTPIVPANKVLVLSKDIRATVHTDL